jgi:hypothetical protein
MSDAPAAERVYAEFDNVYAGSSVRLFRNSALDAGRRYDLRLARGGVLLDLGRCSRVRASGRLRRRELIMADVDMKKVASDFSQYMCTKYGASIQTKETSDLMKMAAFGLDMGRFVGIGGLSSGKDFMTEVTTTIGTTIYMPSSIQNGDPVTFIQILTHECEHVAQFKASAFAFSWLYATESEARVKDETDAYAAGLAITIWLVANVDLSKSAEEIVQTLISNYHLQQADADLATTVLKSQLASLKNGIVMSQSSRDAIAWFEQNYLALKGTL